MEPADFAQRILQIISEGNLTSTYKLAVLLSLVDVSMEHTAVATNEPIEVHQLASKIVDLYWQQTLPYPGYRTGSPAVRGPPPRLGSSR